MLAFGVELTFTNGTVTGIGGTALIAQNAFQVSNVSGEISGNTITAFGYSGGTWYSSA